MAWRIPMPPGPTTTYLAAMKELTRDTNGDGKTDIWGSMIDIGWDRLQVHINAWGAHIVDPVDPSKCVIDSPGALAALEWVRARMWDDHVMATFTDVNNVGTQAAFYGGKLAMVEDGSWGLKNILENADFRVGVAPIPAGPAKRVTLSTTDGFGIYSQTRHPQEAWELVKFLVSKEYGLAMAEANLLQPARLSLVPDWQRFVREQYPTRPRTSISTCSPPRTAKATRSSRRSSPATWTKPLACSATPSQRSSPSVRLRSTSCTT